MSPPSRLETYRITLVCCQSASASRLAWVWVSVILVEMRYFEPLLTYNLHFNLCFAPRRNTRLISQIRFWRSWPNFLSQIRSRRNLAVRPDFSDTVKAALLLTTVQIHMVTDALGHCPHLIILWGSWLNFQGQITHLETWLQDPISWTLLCLHCQNSYGRCISTLFSSN